MKSKDNVNNNDYEQNTLIEKENNKIGKNNIVGLNKVKIIKKIEYDNEGNILSPAVIDLYA